MRFYENWLKFNGRETGTNKLVHEAFRQKGCPFLYETLQNTEISNAQGSWRQILKMLCIWGVKYALNRVYLLALVGNFINI